MAQLTENSLARSANQVEWDNISDVVSAWQNRLKIKIGGKIHNQVTCLTVYSVP